MTERDVGGRAPLTSTDEAAVFGDLFDAHAGPLHAYLGSRVGRTVADDLVAETFLVAYRDRERYDPGRGDVRSWLYGIATNLARHHLRSETRALAAVTRMHAEHAEHEPAPRVPERVDAATSVGRLAAALAALPPGDRDVLLLTAWAELSSGEVAAALEIPVGTVRSRLHRVRQHLRGHLDNHHLEEQ